MSRSNFVTPTGESITHCGSRLSRKKQAPNKMSDAAIEAKIGPAAPTTFESPYDSASFGMTRPKTKRATFGAVLLLPRSGSVNVCAAVKMPNSTN